ncbi:hypothetical protein AMATHDRAFT_58241 [Amanita thiersii Skay4041]|uniref:Uncharacterized protein n=1 Tax=Amanita thiersii Skay4041 TaxID=703135 RepID=A0A2A9NLB8_9AGAR|nr:hypothetical protein AMATHDRAFT_58241 [Amanita thiersii Skay4041]
MNEEATAGGLDVGRPGHGGGYPVWQECCFRLEIRRKVSFDDKPSTGRLEAAVKLVSGRAQEYEYQLRAVESELSTTLSNFRAIDSIMREAYAGIEQHTLRANHALDVQAPYIAQELEDSEKSLTQLTETLPAVDTQVANIKSIYDTGRDEAQRLVDDLTWLNTDFYERWRRIIFTSSSPVSWRWKAVMRTLFAISFVICTVLFWIALSGAYRAHRHRLVWGDKLMS